MENDDMSDNEIIIIEARGDALAKADKWLAKKTTILENAALVTVVDSVERLNASGAVYTEIAKHIKALETERMAITKPLDEVKKQIMDQEKAMRGPLEAEQKRIKGLNDAYATKLAAEAEAERRRLAAEELRQANEAAERAAKAREAFGEDVAIKEPEQAPLAPPPPEKVQLSGARTVKRFSFVVTDPNKVPREYLAVDEARIRAHIKNAEAMGRDPEIPGVRFEAKISVESK